MKDNIRLDDKVALITGAGGVIGTATARLMAARGAHIVAVDRNKAALQTLATKMPSGTRFLALEADVTDESAVRQYVEHARRTLGAIHIFFNNAGIEGGAHGAYRFIPDLPFEEFNTIINVNLNGVFLGMKYVIPVMAEQGGGSIINTASICGIKGSAGQVAYVASKHAVVGMTRSAAIEWSEKGVRVNCVTPGAIESRMMTDFLELADPGAAQQLRKNFEAQLPARRFGAPEEVAAVVAFLASDDAKYVTGAFYAVDGGMSAM
jgi:NAD(P)-dependent dehydrogenase (short-subunit alcohol dehydrogenase family)